jgi:Transposase Tn5 dimerisation domain
MIVRARRSRSCCSGSATEVWCRTDKCFTVPLQPSILTKENDADETALSLHVALQLLHLRLNHQVYRFMGCDCHIEMFFRVLKQGCQIEQLRVQTKPRLVNALAVYLIVAWRIHTIAMLSRAYPEVSCEVVFEPREWQALYIGLTH